METGDILDTILHYMIIAKILFHTIDLLLPDIKKSVDEGIEEAVDVNL
jgi:hypothetical protein